MAIANLATHTFQDMVINIYQMLITINNYPMSVFWI